MLKRYKMKSIFNSMNVDVFFKSVVCKNISDKVLSINFNDDKSLDEKVEKVFLDCKLENLEFNLDEAVFDFKLKRVPKSLLQDVDCNHDIFGTIICVFTLKSGIFDLLLIRAKDMNVNPYINGYLYNNKVHIEFPTNISDVYFKFEESKLSFMNNKKTLINYLLEGKEKINLEVNELNSKIKLRIIESLIQKREVFSNSENRIKFINNII